MITPAEQIERFIKAHPGEWQAVGRRYTPGEPTGRGLHTLAGFVVLAPRGDHVAVIVGAPGVESVTLSDSDADATDILTRIAARIADACQIYEVSADTLPVWLADPVRWTLRTRAGELLTLAGSSPADVVSAAETVDEALCGRPVVEVTSILPALMSIGMSCQWATGADEAADDYVGFVSRRLDVVAGERDGLRAAIVQALADLDAYDRSDGQQALAPLSARAVLRRVLGVT